MPLGTGGTFVTVGGGVHNARVNSLKPELKVFEWGTQAFLSMEVTEGEFAGSNTTWSLPWNSAEFWSVMKILGASATKESMQGVQPQNVLAKLDAELARSSWSGKVRVDDKGWCRGLAIPTTQDLFCKFVGFTTLDADGKPTTKQSEGQFGVKDRTTFDMRVETGEYAGLIVPCSMTVSLKYNASRDELSINEKSALWKVMGALGVVWDEIAGKLQGEGSVRAFFADPTNPLPEFGKIVTDKAAAGWLVKLRVTDRGWIDNDSMTGVSPDALASLTKSVTLADIKRMVDLMAGVSAKMNRMAVVTEAGTLTDDGKFLARNIISALHGTIPGVAKNFDPSNWTPVGIGTMISVMEKLADKTFDELNQLVGADDSVHRRLMDWVADQFPEVAEAAF